MTKIIDLSAPKAKEYLLKGSSYFSMDIPPYMSFAPILNNVSSILTEAPLSLTEINKAKKFENVNYTLITNKDGLYAWRAFELIHPVIYVHIVNLLCEEDNWQLIKNRFTEFKENFVTCCSLPVTSTTETKSDKASQVTSWWHEFEQQSIKYSLDYSHLLITDVTDCYGSLYTHSISWALHTREKAKELRTSKDLLGNRIDGAIQSGRYGQTNGICQGSILMDFIAEIVLGYVDELITQNLKSLKIKRNDFQVLRYRDDYRIFTNNDVTGKIILKSISDNLCTVGMRLNSSKTVSCSNVITGSIKADKLAWLELPYVTASNSKTLQKKLLRIHSFGQRFPNSGTLRKELQKLYEKIYPQKISMHEDAGVLAAIAVDIAITSPSTIPVISGILTSIISRLPSVEDKTKLWKKVFNKMTAVPHNGYLELWLQRIIIPSEIDVKDLFGETICKAVENKNVKLWESKWLNQGSNLALAVASNNILICDPHKTSEIVSPQETALYNKNSHSY